MRVPDQDRKWVESFAARVHRRMQAAGCRTILIEDVQQEAWIAWCKARDGFDQTMGASFGTYLYRGLLLHLNRWADEHISMAQHTALGDDAVTAAEGNVAQYQGRSSQEDDLEAKQYRRHVLARMSQTTRLVVELLESPPAWLMDEFKAMRAKIEWCRTRGFFASGAKDVSLGLIFQAIGLDKTQRERVNAEIRQFASAGE